MSQTKCLAVAAAWVLLGAAAFAQTTPDANSGGTTSGPAVNTPATMNTGKSGDMTASPHQKRVLRDKGHTPTQPDANSSAQPHG